MLKNKMVLKKMFFGSSILALCLAGACKQVQTNKVLHSHPNTTNQNVAVTPSSGSDGVNCAGQDFTGTYMQGKTKVSLEAASTGYTETDTVANSDGAYDGVGATLTYYTLVLDENSCAFTQTFTKSESITTAATASAPFLVTAGPSKSTAPLKFEVNAYTDGSDPSGGFTLLSCNNDACSDTNTDAPLVYILDNSTPATPSTPAAPAVAATLTDCSAVKLTGTWTQKQDPSLPKSGEGSITNAIAIGAADATSGSMSMLQTSTTSGFALAVTKVTGALALDAKSCILSEVDSKSETTTGSVVKEGTVATVPHYSKMIAYSASSPQSFTVVDCTDQNCTGIDMTKGVEFDLN